MFGLQAPELLILLCASPLIVAALAALWVMYVRWLWRR